jgi:hypothetical protein
MKQEREASHWGVGWACVPMVTSTEVQAILMALSLHMLMVKVTIIGRVTCIVVT